MRGVCHDAAMVIEFVKAQCTTSVKGVDTWLWLAWQPKPGDFSNDHSWVRLEKAWVSPSEWDVLRELVKDNLGSPSMSGGGGGSEKAAAWKRWHIRRTDNGWRLAAQSEPWPELSLRKSVGP
jgi:hypothetical protein